MPPTASVPDPAGHCAAEPDEGVVGPLDRGLAVLRAMSRPGNHRLRPSDLVHATGLARATVDRVLGTLLRLGYVRQAGRDVELTPRLMEFGNGYLTACGVPDALGPFAGRLADGLNESVSVAVPDGDGVRFVVQVTRRRTLSLAFRVGDLLPAERCAPGALFAAEWSPEQFAAWRDRRAGDPGDEGFPAMPRRTAPPPDADARFRRRVAAAAASGWSSDDQLVEQGLIAMAVPVRDTAGRAVCAVSVVSHTSRHSLQTLRDAVLPGLRAMVPDMEQALAEHRERPRPTGTDFRGAAGTPLPRSAGADLPPPAGTGPSGSAGTGLAERGDPVRADRQRPAPVRPAPAAPAPGAAYRAGADPARAAKRELGAGFLQSLARGLGVLAALGSASGGLTLSEAAGATGLARATARRSLLTLEQLGYAETDGRRFRPSPRVLELGYAHLSRLDFTDIVRPHLERLAAEVHESASMSVLDGDDIRYVARVPTYRIMSVDITVGTRFPAYATSMGRVLLAGLDTAERAACLDRVFLRPLTRYTLTSPAALGRVLDEVAASGHALVDEELEEGLRSLAVPVRDGDGRTAAAVNVSTHTGRGTAEEARAALLPPLAGAAAGIEADLRIAWERNPSHLS